MNPSELIAYWQHGEAIANGSPLPASTQRELYTAATFGHLGILATAYAAEGLEYDGVSGIKPGEFDNDYKQELRDLDIVVSGIYAHTSRSRAEEIRQTISSALPIINEKLVQFALGKGINLGGETTDSPNPAIFALRNTGALYVAGNRRSAPIQLRDNLRRIRQHGAYQLK